MSERNTYRGKQDNGEWITGSLFLTDTDATILIELSCYCDGFRQAYGEAVDPDTVGQCTGLRDMNGTLIFEGDILQFDDVDGIWQSAVVFVRGLYGLDTHYRKQIKNPDGWDQPHNRVNSRWWTTTWGYEEWGTAFTYRKPLAQRTVYSEGKQDDTETYRNSEYAKWHEKHGWEKWRVEAVIVGNIHDTPELLEQG